MSKKHKKKFKQKIKEILKEMERGKAEPVVSPFQETEAPPLPPEPKEEIPKPAPLVAPKPKSVVKPEISPPIISTLTPLSILKNDLKKIVLLSGLVIFILIVATILSSKTNWLLDLADKIYNWAQLGS